MTEQMELIGGAQPHFDGETYDPRVDHERLTTMLQRTAHCLLEREWWTLERLAMRIGSMGGAKPSEAGVSARLRDLRKPKFAQVEIDRFRVKGGLWHYRVNPTSIHRLARWLKNQ